MLYSISYDDGWTDVTKGPSEDGLTRTETFRTEGEALIRAFRLLDDGRHHAVSLCDGSGNVLCGVRLQLKLGFHTE
jgi:hypothetical protein